MKIETKFKPGDDVLFYDRGKLNNGTIWNISILVDNKEISEVVYNVINYSKEYLTYAGGNRNFPENMLFETKEDFTKSL